MKVICPMCNGEGEDYASGCICLMCKGSGEVEEELLNSD